MDMLSFCNTFLLSFVQICNETLVFPCFESHHNIISNDRIWIWGKQHFFSTVYSRVLENLVCNYNFMMNSEILLQKFNFRLILEKLCKSFQMSQNKRQKILDWQQLMRPEKVPKSHTFMFKSC